MAQNTSNPHEALVVVAKTLAEDGLISNISHTAISDHYWEVNVATTEHVFFNRKLRLQIIKTITDAIDKRYGIYTCIFMSYPDV